MLSLALWTATGAQTTPTQSPSQTPKTSPQTEQVLPSYEGQKVASVELAGQPQLNLTDLEPLLSQKAGQPFSRAQVDASIAALKRTGRFHDVELQIRPEPNGVRVLFVLQPAIYFGIYDFPGATNRFAYARLLQVSNYPPRGAYTPVDVQEARDNLLTFFHRTGYFQAVVQPEIQTDNKDGIANVIFRVKLNKKAKFGNLNIEGPTPEETAKLKSALTSLFWARLRNSAIRAGKTYNLKTLQNASQYLETTLNKQDHLAAQVRLIGANYNPETNRADISFHVQPGPIVHVKVENLHLWPWTRHKLLPVYQQAGVNPEIIAEGRQNLANYLQSKGYFDARVTSDVRQQGNAESIVYQVTKGPRHKVADVEIAGNQHISSKELHSHVTVDKAHLFSHGKFSDKLVRASVKNLKGVYAAEGYSSATVTPQVTTKGGNVVVTFHVDEGPQDIVEALRIEGNDTMPVVQLAPKGLRVEGGKPYSQKAVTEDRNEIMARYLGAGYLNATFRETTRQIAPHRLEVVYQINEGPQVHTATIVTLGRQHTQQTLISRDIAQIQKGKPLTEDSMLSSETRLYTAGVFDWAEIDPRRRISTQTQEDVLVKLHESRRNTLTYGFGFEVINRGGSVPSGTIAVPGVPPVGLPKTFKTSEKTFYGPRGTIEYTRANLRGKAESLSFNGLAGRLDQRGSVTYSDPNFRWTKWTSNWTLSGEHNSENPIFTSRLGQFGWQLQRPLNPDKTQNFFLRYNYRQTGLTRLLLPELVPDQDRHVRLSGFSGSYIRDTRDSALDAHKGIYESFDLGITPSALGSSVDFARLLAQSSYYKKIPKNIIWANSLRIGLEKPLNGSHVPISESFFSGGGSTLRGFPLNGAGPQRTITACGSGPNNCFPLTVPIGGNQLFIVNSEFRIPIDYDLPVVSKNLGVALFYDGGNVFRRIGFHGQYTNSIGGGLRYHTPVGPVRIDIGHNLNAPVGIKKTQLFITLGQAF